MARQNVSNPHNDPKKVAEVDPLILIHINVSEGHSSSFLVWPEVT